MVRDLNVLNLEWTSLPHRDRESATLVCNYLRLNGLSVLEESIHNGYRLLRRFRPKVLLMTNTIGSTLNVQIAAYAKSLGIPVIATISEGLFYDGWEEQMFWGANRGKVAEDIRLLWSEASRRVALKVAPQFKERLMVAGSVGADRFVISDEKAGWLDRRSPDQIVVGFGCFDFGFVEPNHGYFSFMKSMMGTDGLARYSADRDRLNALLLDVIRRNPETIFLIKEHPGAEGDHRRGAIAGVAELANAYMVLHEHSLTQCIAESDFWVSYESTTALEAWLMGKQTAVINPTGTDLPYRHAIWEGQPNFQTVEDLEYGLKHFRLARIVPGFAELAARRIEIMHDIVQWTDGLNHVRVGNVIIEFLGAGNRAMVHSPDVCPPSRRELLRQRLSWLKVQGIGRLSRFISSAPRDMRFWDSCEVNELQQLRLRQQLQQYARLGHDLAMLRSIKAN